MLHPREITKWILENCVDENGDVDISCLNFWNFEGNVKMCNIKVKHNLYQNMQIVGGDLHQNYQYVEGAIYQERQTSVQEKIKQNYVAIRMIDKRAKYRLLNKTKL